MSQKRRFQFHAADVRDAARLVRALNDFANEIQSRIEALETGRREVRTMEVTTGAAVGIGVAPFPIQLDTDGSPVGLSIVRVENLSSSTGLSAAPALQWRAKSSGAELTGCVGLSANTRYRLGVEILYG